MVLVLLRVAILLIVLSTSVQALILDVFDEGMGCYSESIRIG
jgi:hypothetical protein